MQLLQVNYQCNCAVNVAWCCGFYPAKSLNDPSKSLDFVPGPFRILELAHVVIWQGRIHNTTPHLQHRCVNSYNLLQCPLSRLCIASSVWRLAHIANSFPTQSYGSRMISTTLSDLISTRGFCPRPCKLRQKSGKIYFY